MLRVIVFLVLCITAATVRLVAVSANDQQSNLLRMPPQLTVSFHESAERKLESVDSLAITVLRLVPYDRIVAL